MFSSVCMERRCEPRHKSGLCSDEVRLRKPARGGCGSSTGSNRNEWFDEYSGSQAQEITRDHPLRARPPRAHACRKFAPDVEGHFVSSSFAPAAAKIVPKMRAA